MGHGDPLVRSTQKAVAPSESAAPDQHLLRRVRVGITDAFVLGLPDPVLPKTPDEGSKVRGMILPATARCSRQYVWMVPGE